MQGALVSELQYDAWGVVHYFSGTIQPKYQYTGQYAETTLGLDFFQARYYDPAIAHFVQADSIVPAGVQGYDRFAYVNNNPVNLIDPSGHVSCSGSNWDDGPQCKKKGDSKDHYNVLKHPEHFKLTKEQKEVVKLLQGCAGGSVPSGACTPYEGTSISNWPPSGYYVSGYDTVINIEWSKIDWPSLILSGAGVIGDSAVIATVVFAATGLEPAAAVTGQIAIGGELINKGQLHGISTKP